MSEKEANAPEKNLLPLEESMMKNERRVLIILAFFILLYLAAITLVSIFSLLSALSANENWMGFPLQPLICVLAGSLGSAIRAIRSACERIACGWELSDGSPLPQEKPKGKFGARLIPGFLLRPLIGAAAGLVLYLGVLGGTLVFLKDNRGLNANAGHLAFFAFVVGLYAKTFLENLFSSLPKKGGTKEKEKNEGAKEEKKSKSPK